MKTRFAGLTVAAARERASTVLVVLVLLACLVLLIAANSGTLSHFKEELKLLDRQQLEKYGPGAAH